MLRRVLVTLAVLSTVGLGGTWVALRKPWLWAAQPLDTSQLVLHDWPTTLDWQPVRPGIERLQLSLSTPRPLVLHALRIDLRTPDLQAVNDRDNGPEPRETAALFTSTFAREYDCVVAVNAAPFSPVVNDERTGLDILGLHVVDGVQVSGRQGSKTFGALGFAADRRATILDPPFDELAGIVTAVGGFDVNLRDGRVIVGDQQLHPRTAAGVSADGQTLWLVAIDGRQPGYSEGVTTGDLGYLLRALGADDGLNLDGGGTTAMALRDDRGEVRIVNRPIHQGEPGRERPAASHLGFRISTVPTTTVP